MQSMPSLLRQSLRCRTSLTKTSPHLPLTLPLKSIRPAIVRKTLRSGLICPLCQFRVQTRCYASQGKGSPKNDREPEGKEIGNSSSKWKGNSEPSLTTTSRPMMYDIRHEETAYGEGQAGLPSQAESRRSNFSKQFTHLMDNLQSNVFIAGQRLNDLTGYSAIESLKQDIQAQENRVRETRALVRQAKGAYASTINRRSASQREVNELLQRKHAWTPSDLERFTSLYRSDHANERAESDAQEALAVAERDAEEAAARLSKSILARYHEEQIWSDKIRRMSTWGTWGLMGVNVLLFLIFQVAVEPWRRRRLVRGFEEKVVEALEKGSENEQSGGQSKTTPRSDGTLETGRDPLRSVPAVEAVPPTVLAELSSGRAKLEAPNVVDTPSSPAFSSDPSASDSSLQTTQQQNLQITPLPPLDASLSPDFWKQILHDLFSERQITLTQRDLTIVALESAAAGAAAAGLLIAIFRPR